MPKHKSVEETYDLCLANGLLTELSEANTERARSLASNASLYLEGSKRLSKGLSSSDPLWLIVYTLQYDALHLYAESLLLLSKVSSSNHQCLFAALCFRNKDFDWNFFERVRTQRNSIHYYGKQIGYNEWKEVEMGFTLTISLLKKEIEGLLGS